MVEVSVERKYEFSAEAVWAVFADFGNVSWVPGVERVDLEGEGVGMVRHLTVPVFSQLHERLEAIDREKMVLEYSIPSVEYIQLENYRARAQVVDLGSGHCRVLMSCKADAVGPEAEAVAKTEAFYEAMLGWIGDYLERPRRFEIEGKTLGFPALFQDGSSAVGLFTVPAGGTRALIGDSGFEVAEIWPGRAGFSLACCHYRESDCGVYNEIAMGFFVKPRHGRSSRIPYLGTWLDIVRNDSATYVWKLPVTTKLANDAGVLMWGFPKTVEEIDFDVAGGRAMFRLRMGGREVLTYSVPAAGKRDQPPGASAVYSIYEGAPHVTYLNNEYHDVGVSLRGGRLSLGDHPVAEQLRALGLPRRPLVATWIGRLSFNVGAPERI